MREEIKGLLHKEGPLTGKEIHESIRKDILELWKACNTCNDIVLHTVATRYLRLDKHVEGYARLSPSILREFYSYTVVGLKNQSKALSDKSQQIHEGILQISKNKLNLALTTVARIVENLQDASLIRDRACFMISGDVAYGMAHLEPRPEFSTGKLVNGSDLDIVVVYENLPGEISESLDSAIYEQKYFLLNNPSYKEEIDYVIKDISKVQTQLAFSDFKSMVASKVLEESLFLYGNRDLFLEIKNMAAARGIPKQLATLYDNAMKERENARQQLLALNSTFHGADTLNLFYSNDEREEFY